MNILINKEIKNKKSGLLEYYRGRGSELISESRQTFSDSEYKQRASFVNKGLIETKDNILKIVGQKSTKESWETSEVLEGVLLINYTNYICMLEARNYVWPYDYMAFTRRIGELWEPFCLNCWEYPLNTNLNYFIPPLFKDVKENLTNDINQFINKLNISQKEKNELKDYYQKVWTLVTSGEIKLELDLHFEKGKNKYVVDFKSGFSSNEKGNTNRLLLVASIYRIIEQGHRCLIFVRSTEEHNNHYLQTLKKSELWDVYCGKETYKKIEEFTGFDLEGWMKTNIKWEKDFSIEMFSFLKKNKLTKYLEW